MGRTGKVAPVDIIDLWTAHFLIHWLKTDDLNLGNFDTWVIYKFTEVQLRSMYKMLSGFEHGLVSIVSFEFFTDDTVPETIIVLIEVYW